MSPREFAFAFIAVLVCAHSLAADRAMPQTSAVEEQASPRLTTEWWQWAMSAPIDQSPVSDLTGEHCAQGQRGSTWFLAGGFGSSLITRICTVPAGKFLFFPLINMAYWPRKGVTTVTCEETRNAASLNNDTALDLFVELDGVSIGKTGRRRLKSDQCFDIYARVPASERPYRGYPAATDGFWVLLKPLSPGRHLLRFGGRYNRSSVEEGRMMQDIEYTLIVQ